jgi:8-oxo-dGTP pyrophosphatase MutT (NUDIX family)
VGVSMQLIRERLSRLDPRTTADRLWLAPGASSADSVEAPETQDAASKRAAVATILRSRPDGPEVLLIRRAENPQDPWSGHMAFPGGREAPQDPDLLATAIRETLEEIGLDLHRSAHLLGRLDALPAVARGRRVGLTIAPFVFELTEDAPLEPNYEVAEWIWAPLDPLLRGALATTMPYEFEGQRLSLPAHDVQGRLVWGLTHRMLETLFAQLR